MAFAGLFIFCAAAQAVAGLMLYREQHGGRIGFLGFLGTGSFLDGMFTNWQAAVLQLACLIIFGTFLLQKGATHSKKELRRVNAQGLPRIGHVIYRNSLGLAFVLLFLGCFALHLIFGARAYNEKRAASNKPPMTVTSFAVSAKFWFSNFQTWEAEFFAIGLYLVLSIYLRQKGSPESKPTASTDAETGEANK